MTVNDYIDNVSARFAAAELHFGHGTGNARDEAIYLIYSVLDIDFSIRVGINTGMVTTGAVGKKREGDYTVYGDAVNLASRMESNAPINKIMIT